MRQSIRSTIRVIKGSLSDMESNNPHLNLNLKNILFVGSCVVQVKGLVTSFSIYLGSWRNL